MTTIDLPRADGTWEARTLNAARDWPAIDGFTSRVAFGAAHVITNPLGDNTPGAPAQVDWDATLAFRTHLFAMVSALPRPWTPRSAAWAWTGRPLRR